MMIRPAINKNGMAIMNGETGPYPKDSANILENTPALMARTPFQKVDLEKVTDSHSLGKSCVSVCSYTYQDSKVENNMEVEIPPNTRPKNNQKNCELSFVRQQNEYITQNVRAIFFLPNLSARGPVAVPNTTLLAKPTTYKRAICLLA